MESFFPLLLGSAALLLLPLLLISYMLLPNSKEKSTHLPLPPGPKGWPVLGNLPQLGPMPHHTLAALARTYGPLYRLRLGLVDVVVAADSVTASLFLKTHDINFANRPSPFSAKLFSYNFQDMAFAPYGPRWRMFRKLCYTHLFSAKALGNFQHVRSEEVSLMVQRLAGVDSAMNVAEEVNACVTNALGRVTIGRRVVVPGKASTEYKEMITEMAQLIGASVVVDYLPQLRWLDPQGIVAQTKRVFKRFDAFLDGIIAGTDSRQVCGAEGSFLNVLVGLKGKENFDGEGGKISETDIKALLMNLFTAGTDTTPSTVEWALAELIRHPDVLLKLQQELDSVVGRDRLVSESDLPSLPYLRAVVKETFRLHPPTPLSLPHYAAESCEVAGYHIPKNTTLLINVWAIGRDPNTWIDPLEFRPARFLPGGERPDADVQGKDFEVIPFGAGRRICAGMSLGMRMMQFLVATLAHSFEWELADKEKLNMDEEYGMTLQRAEPLVVYPIKRLMPAAYNSRALRSEM